MSDLADSNTVDAERAILSKAMAEKGKTERLYGLRQTSVDRSSTDISAPRHPPRGEAKKGAIDRSGFGEFRRLCDALFFEAVELEDHLKDGIVDELGLPNILKVEELVDQLFNCAWGQPECLARVAVAIESQIGNAEWTDAHVVFLKDYLGFLRTRYVVDDSTVAECYSAMKSHGLDPFRGTVSDSGISKR